MSHRLPLADIAFIADFAAFARSKGDEAYDFVANTNCACAQFLRETGRGAKPWVCVEDYYPSGIGGPKLPLPAGLGGTHQAINSLPYTFSALADRLEALIANAPEVSQ